MKINNLFFFFSFFLFIFLDQFLKYLIRLQNGFYICNKGAAFGIPVPSFIIWIAAGIVLLFLLIFKKKLNQHFLCWSLFLAGITSNLIDRLFFGCVIDFIDLKFWPIFNLADVFIVVGSVFLLVKYLKK